MKRISTIIDELFEARINEIAVLTDEDKAVMDLEEEKLNIDTYFEKLSKEEKNEISQYVEKLKENIDEQNGHFYAKYYKTGISDAIRFIVEALVYQNK